VLRRERNRLAKVFAFTLKLLLQPVFRILESLRVPKALAALALIVALFARLPRLATFSKGRGQTIAAASSTAIQSVAIDGAPRILAVAGRRHATQKGRQTVPATLPFAAYARR
jgi:hypothetical protein